MEKITLCQRIWRTITTESFRAFIGSILGMKKRVRKGAYGVQNPKITFFIIRFNGKAMGLYSSIFCILPYLRYCDKKGYTPLIDYKNQFNPMLQESEFWGCENAWEYYYLQPCKKYTLEEAYKSQKVILGSTKLLAVGTPQWNKSVPCSKYMLKKWNKVIEKNLILQPHLDKQIEATYNIIFPNNEKVMGVGIRAGFRAGMMGNYGLFNSHSKVPTCEEFIKLIQLRLDDWKCKYLFLSVDDREYCNKIKSQFGDKCLIYDRKRINYFKNDKPVLDAKEIMCEYSNSSVRERNEEYIVELYLLARCNYLYANLAGGTEFVYFLNGGQYEKCKFYNDGFYEGLGENK